MSADSQPPAPPGDRSKETHNFGDNPPADPGAESATVAAQLTPAGRSAIAVVAAAGPRAERAVDACFQAANGQRLADQPVNAIRFGRWGGDGGEELVVCRCTGEDQLASWVEIHCHGGRAAVRAVLDDLVANGCQEIDWREWGLRASPAVITAEAEAALADALTERTAAVLLDQRDGALATEVRHAIAALERGDTILAGDVVNALLERSALGSHLTTPWRVVLAGPPNVGKSSLMNAIVGYQRAIVFDQPGTTRDVVTATTAIDGWPVQLSDTAGIRDATDRLEAAGVEHARQTLAEADLVLAVAEAGGESESGWETIESQAPAGVPVVRIISKADQVEDAAALPRGLITSAVTGAGIETLLDAIAAALVPSEPDDGAGVPFTNRQAACLTQARDHLSAEDVDAATAALLALLAPDSDGLRSS